jgi:hypothetical protein
MVEALRVLRLARTTAVKSRRAAPQLLRNQIFSAPEELRDRLRNLTRMQLIRTCAAWRPVTSGLLPASSGKTQRHRLNRGGRPRRQQRLAHGRDQPPADGPGYQGVRRPPHRRGPRQA